MKIAKKIFHLIALSLLVLPGMSSSCQAERQVWSENSSSSDNLYTDLSAELLERVKNDLDLSQIIKKLAEVRPDSLQAYLLSAEQKKAFWINIYNAHIQLILKENPELFENRGRFFGDKRITIAQQELSFDDIEHGIIRGSQVKLALGLIQNPFADKFEKKFRVKQVDGRIHFALNCGAKSCPDIVIYHAANFNKMIDQNAQNFLNQVCRYDQENDKVYLTPLFSWFRGDFGGRSGVLEYLEKYQVIPSSSEPNIEYQSYDWTLSLDNYYDAD